MLNSNLRHARIQLLAAVNSASGLRDRLKLREGEKECHYQTMNMILIGLWVTMTFG